MRRVDSLEKADAERDWGQEEKGMTEDEMGRWHHRLDGREMVMAAMKLKDACSLEGKL